MIELFSSSFIQNFLLGGTLLAILCGLLGCFLLWRRMTFFSDALAHASLLGVALGLWLAIDLLWGVVGICLMVAVILAVFSRKERSLPIDTWLNVISYGGLSGGMIALSQLQGVKIDPQSFLFGDPLSLSHQDIIVLGSGLVVTFLYVSLNWRSLLFVMMDAEMAAVHGISVKSVEIVFIIILAIVVAVGLKTVGALLLPALMIFPAATYGLWARSPESMVSGACGCALISLWGGSFISFYQDWPTGPSIILAALVIFLFSFGIRSFIK